MKPLGQRLEEPPFVVMVCDSYKFSWLIRQSGGMLLEQKRSEVSKAGQHSVAQAAIRESFLQHCKLQTIHMMAFPSTTGFGKNG